MEDEGRQKGNLEEELSTLCGQTAGADIVWEFKASQSFIDSCAKYYGIGFEDYLKQVASAYPNLDLSEITMDDPMLSTKGVQKTHRLAKPDPTQLDSPGWVGF